MKDDTKLAASLLTMRVTIFIVMLMWTVDKLIRPEHASAVYDAFYGLSSVTGHIMTTIGVLELMLIVGFVLGLFKSVTYLIVLILHTISTFSSVGAYLSPFTGNHLLFFAALPMWAACLGLYLMRGKDTLLSLSKA